MEKKYEGEDARTIQNAIFRLDNDNKVVHLYQLSSTRRHHLTKSITRYEFIKVCSISEPPIGVVEYHPGDRLVDICLIGRGEDIQKLEQDIERFEAKFKEESRKRPLNLAPQNVP